MRGDVAPHHQHERRNEKDETMNELKTNVKIKSIKVNAVAHVYSGRPGCCCGCQGKHTYASAHRDCRPSYYDDDECVNDHVIKRHVNTINRLLAEVREGADYEVTIEHDGTAYVAVNTSSRLYIAYFAKKK